MKINSGIQFYALAFLILAILTNPVSATGGNFGGSIADPITGAITGGGNLGLCNPTENKTCIIMDDEIITVKTMQNGVQNQYLYNLNTCFEGFRGDKQCDPSQLTVTTDNVQIIDRNKNEITFGKDQVYINLRGRNERILLNGQMVPEFYNLNIGQGRVNTNDTRFSLRKTDGLLVFASDTNRRNGVEYFQYNAAPKTDNRVVTKRANLIHKIIAQVDATNSPNCQILSVDTGSILLKIIHETPATLNLANINDGQGVNNGGSGGGSGGGGGTTLDPNIGTFEIDIDGQRFNVRSTVPSVIAQIRAILAGTSTTSIANAHIEGEIATGTVSYNSAWGFSLVPSTVQVFTGVEYSCDGVPSVINRHLGNVGSVDFYFDRVWCPNSSRLVREIL